MGAKVADTLTKSTHGSTFGGNPVCAAGALNILSRIDDALLDGVRRKGGMIREYFKNDPGVENISGMGLMLGLKTVRSAGEICAAALEKGLLVLTAKDRVRLLPALNIPDALLEEGLSLLKAAIHS